jgi:hypothetical protein
MKLIRTLKEFNDWCETNHISRDEIASSIGITRQTLYNWTSGRTRIFQKNDGEELPDDEIIIPKILSLCVFALQELKTEMNRGKKIRKKFGSPR